MKKDKIFCWEEIRKHDIVGLVETCKEEEEKVNSKFEGYEYKVVSRSIKENKKERTR